MYVATQTIASAFGTFLPGDGIDADLPEPVAEAWLAAGLIEDAPAVAETASSAPDEPKQAPKPTPAKQERVVKTPARQRRFVEDASTGPTERTTTGPQG